MSDTKTTQKMKTIYRPIFLCLALLAVSACFEDYEERYLFTDNRVEFQDAVINSNAPGKSFPILPPLANDVGSVQYRINMTGEQQDVARQVDFRVVPEETTAQEGKDYALPEGKSITIPANSSFGYLTLEVLPGGSGSPTVVFELLETGDIGVLDRYHRIGVRIAYPKLSPDPAEVVTINDIQHFTNLTFGANSNQNVGNFIDALSGDAYITAGADNNNALIDFIVLRSGAGTEQNVLTPSNSAVTAWGSTSHIPDQWTVRNDGELVRIADPTEAELLAYQNASSKAELLALYDALVLDIEDRPGYSSHQGPGTRIRSMATGDLMLFRSVDRDVIAIMQIKEVVNGSTGHIQGEMKSGGEG